MMKSTDLRNLRLLRVHADHGTEYRQPLLDPQLKYSLCVPKAHGLTVPLSLLSIWLREMNGENRVSLALVHRFDHAGNR